MEPRDEAQRGGSAIEVGAEDLAQDPVADDETPALAAQTEAPAPCDLVGLEQRLERDRDAVLHVEPDPPEVHGQAREGDHR